MKINVYCFYIIVTLPKGILQLTYVFRNSIEPMWINKWTALANTSEELALSSRVSSGSGSIKSGKTGYSHRFSSVIHTACHNFHLQNSNHGKSQDNICRRQIYKNIWLLLKNNGCPIFSTTFFPLKAINSPWTRFPLAINPSSVNQIQFVKTNRFNATSPSNSVCSFMIKKINATQDPATFTAKSPWMHSKINAVNFYGFGTSGKRSRKKTGLSLFIKTQQCWSTYDKSHWWVYGKTWPSCISS